MERKSWLWRRRSSEKSSGETESSGSVSSERFSDEQDVSRASPNHTQSPEISSDLAGNEVQDNTKSLTEKLSAALSNIRAKDALVKQHSKVAEEAVSGWEKAENEVAALKEQFESASQKNLVLEDRVDHLDAALKECLRQLRQARDEQEQKIHEAIIKARQEWETANFQRESQLAELETHLEAAKAEVSASVDHEIHSKLDSTERENSALKRELLARAEELEVMAIERELSTQAAETASKQHLESIKKVAKLEAECRRLRAMARKSSSFAHRDLKPASPSPFYLESLKDCQSDSGEGQLAAELDMCKMGRLESSDCNVSCSDSWPSSLVSDGQFKDKKVYRKALSGSLTSTSVDIDIMDDFLEMEKLAAMPDVNNGDYVSCIGTARSLDDGLGVPYKAELQALIQRLAELEEKLEKAEDEKNGLEKALAESQDQLKLLQSRLMEVEEKVLELQRQLASSNETNQATKIELEDENTRRVEAESLLESVNSQVHILHEKVASLEVQLEIEKASSGEIVDKCQCLEAELARRQHEAEFWATNLSDKLKIKEEEGRTVAAGKLADCQKTIASLGQQLKSLASLEDFLIDSDVSGLNHDPPVNRSSSTKGSLSSSNSFIAKKDVCPSKPISGLSSNTAAKDSPPSVSSSSSVNRPSETSRNVSWKLSSRSKVSSNLRQS